MKRGWFLFLALSLGLNAGLFYVRLADRPARQSDRSGPPLERPHRPPPPDVIIDEHLQGMTRHLDLSEEQQAAIKDILDRNMPLMSELLRRSQEANRSISEAFAAAEFDAGRFHELVRQASLARSRADSVSAVMLEGEAAILTPAQRARFAEVAPMVYANPREVRPAPGARQ